VGTVTTLTDVETTSTLRRLVSGETMALVELLATHDADDVTQGIAAFLWRGDPATVWRVVAQLEATEGIIMAEQTTRARLGLLGARDKVLTIAQQRAAEARVRLQREIGRLLESLGDDVGGRVGEGADEPLARTVRRTLGLSSTDASRLRKLAKVDDAKVERYIGLIRSGKQVPRSPATIAQQIDRAEWSSDECYTPREWTDAARVALGGEIGFDAASNLAAQAGLVRALGWCSLDETRPTAGERERNLAEALGFGEIELEQAAARWVGTDGLAHEWADRWWLNPPFSGAAVERFHARVRAEAREGKRGVLLVNADTSNDDQIELLRRCVVAWPTKRIAFWMPTGEQLRGNRAAQVVFGINVEPDAWAQAMQGLAVCSRPWSSAIEWPSEGGEG
jgi:hypothetical protein